jgi:hypothetical protein
MNSFFCLFLFIFIFIFIFICICICICFFFIYLGLFATRDFEADEVIFSEIPFITSPVAYPREILVYKQINMYVN